MSSRVGVVHRCGCHKRVLSCTETLICIVDNSRPYDVIENVAGGHHVGGTLGTVNVIDILIIVVIRWQ